MLLLECFEVESSSTDIGIISCLSLVIELTKMLLKVVLLLGARISVVTRWPCLSGEVREKVGEV